MHNYVKLSLACTKCLIWDNKKTEIKVFGFPSLYPTDSLGNVRLFEDNFKPLDEKLEQQANLINQANNALQDKIKQMEQLIRSQ